MTVKEMHIDVETQVQRLSANKNRKLSPEQIDWFLNRTQQVMLDAATEPIEGSGRFRIRKDKNDTVSGLLSGRTPLPTSWITDRYVTFLPSDFWCLLDDGSSVCQICTGEQKVISYQVLKVTSVQFPFSIASDNFYGSLSLSYNGSTIIDLTPFLNQRQRQYTGFTSKEEHFYVLDLLMDLLGQKGIQVYWERFYDIYQPYTLLFVSTTTAVPISLTIDGATYTGTTQDRTLELHSGQRPSTLVPNTMVSSDKGIATGVTPYFKTSYISPMSEIAPAAIQTYADKSFIVYQTTINYVRKPRTISLTLGTDCQLNTSVHLDLCSKTAEMILNRIADPTWKEQVQQNTLLKTS